MGIYSCLSCVVRSGRTDVDMLRRRRGADLRRRGEVQATEVRFPQRCFEVALLILMQKVRTKSYPLLGEPCGFVWPFSVDSMQCPVHGRPSSIDLFFVRRCLSIMTPSFETTGGIMGPGTYDSFLIDAQTKWKDAPWQNHLHHGETERTDRSKCNSSIVCY